MPEMPVQCHRLFFMLRPPIVLARQIASAAHWFEDGRGLLAPERLHVTLDILDDLAAPDEALAGHLIEVGDQIAVAPFTITLDRVVGSGRSIALRSSARIDGIEALRDALVRERSARGVPERIGYRFTTHMTLGYRKGLPFSERIAPVTWQADAFELVHSHVGRTRHDVLGRWALDGVLERQLALL